MLFISTLTWLDSYFLFTFLLPPARWVQNDTPPPQKKVWGSEGEVEKITSIYTHFHFSLENVAAYWAALWKRLLSAWHVHMCVACVDNGQTLLASELSQPPVVRMNNTPHPGLLLSSLLIFTFLSSPHAKGWDKGGPVSLPFLFVCVSGAICVGTCRGSVLFLQEMERQWALCRGLNSCHPGSVCIWVFLSPSLSGS